MPDFSRRTFVTGCAASFATGLGGAASPALAAASSPASRLRVGVNLAGAEFRTIGGRWKWPGITNVKYYLSQGFNIFRIPFKWDRLQPDLGGALDEEAMRGLDEIVRTITAAGAVAMLDSHDYGRRADVVIGTSGSPVNGAAFANFWGRLANRYRRDHLVWYNLMNEPHDQDAMLNLAVQNAACASIRRAGVRSKVLFSGTGWTDAGTWVKRGNARVMLGAVDPANNYGFDVHQYLGEANLGKPLKAFPGIGGRVLAEVYNWGKVNKKKVLLGEFSINREPQSMHEVELMLQYKLSGPDRWCGEAANENDEEVPWIVARQIDFQANAALDHHQF
jgi:endoglucanase